MESQGQSLQAANRHSPEWDGIERVPVYGRGAYCPKCDVNVEPTAGGACPEHGGVINENG